MLSQPKASAWGPWSQQKFPVTFARGCSCSDCICGTYAKNCHCLTINSLLVYETRRFILSTKYRTCLAGISEFSFLNIVLWYQTVLLAERSVSWRQNVVPAFFYTKKFELNNNNNNNIIINNQIIIIIIIIINNF